MGSQATNNLKKIVESLQFFSLSLSTNVKWPMAVRRLGEYLEIFTFSTEFFRPECVSTGLNWFNIFLTSVFIVPLCTLIVVCLNDHRARSRYEETVQAIHSERQDDGEAVYWIERKGFFGRVRRTKESKGGDKIVQEIQRQYRFRVSLRNFGVLSMTVLYLPIIRVALQSFDCIQMDGIDGTRLEHDIDIDCTSSGHKATQAAAALALIGIGIGMPLAIFAQVRQIRVSGKLDDPRTLDMFGSLYDIYRREEVSYDNKVHIARIREAVLTSRTLRRKPSSSIKVEEVFDGETNDVIADVDICISNAFDSANETSEDEASSERGDDVECGFSTRDEDDQKLSKVFKRVSTKLLHRTPSARARVRAEKMHWKDCFALYYLAIELIQKSAIIFMTSRAVDNSSLSGWGLVLVHWFIAAFVYTCQPWRSVTLGFGTTLKVPNALNRAEWTCALLQGVVPLLALAFPTRRDESEVVKENVMYDTMTAFLTMIITGLLLLRLLVFVADRFATERVKFSIMKDPNACMEKVHNQLVEFAKSGRVVKLFAFKNYFDVKRRKMLARLGDTRHAMLMRVDRLKDSSIAHDDIFNVREVVGAKDALPHKEQIHALHQVANEMAHIMNSIVPNIPPSQSAESVLGIIETKLENDLHPKRERHQASDEAERFAAVLHLALEIHAYDQALVAIHEHMQEYAAAESIEGLIILGQKYKELKHAVDVLPHQFGFTKLQSAIAYIRSNNDITQPLHRSAMDDDLSKCISTLTVIDKISNEHLNWCHEQLEFIAGIIHRDEAVLSLVPPRSEWISDDVFKSAAKVLRSHELQISRCIRTCEHDWLPLFKHFGRVKYLRLSSERAQSQLSIDTTNMALRCDEANEIYKEYISFSTATDRWCGQIVDLLARSSLQRRFSRTLLTITESMRTVRKEARKQKNLATNAFTALQELREANQTALAARAVKWDEFVRAQADLESALETIEVNLRETKEQRARDFIREQSRVEELRRQHDYEFHSKMQALEKVIAAAKPEAKSELVQHKKTERNRARKIKDELISNLQEQKVKLEAANDADDERFKRAQIRTSRRIERHRLEVLRPKKEDLAARRASYEAAKAVSRQKSTIQHLVCVQDAVTRQIEADRVKAIVRNNRKRLPIV